MAKFSQFEQAWMVKSAGLVLGPLSYSELTKAVREKRISFLDEVKLPNQRWGFLREHPELTQFVIALREEEENAKEDTNITNARTRTMTLTDTDDKTPAPQRSKEPLRGVGIKAPESKQKNQNDLNDTKLPVAESAAKPTGANPTKKNNFVWVAAGVTLLVVLGISFYILNHKNAESKALAQNPAMELLTEAIHFKNMGFYSKAAERYHQASQFRELDFAIQVEMLPVLVQNLPDCDDAIQIGKRAISDNQISPELKQKVLNWVAMANIKKGNYTEAEAIYSKIKDTTPEKYISINRVIEKYFARDFEFVKEQFDSLSSQGIRSPILIILAALALFEQEKTPSDERLKAVMSAIDETLEERPDYSSQLNLAQIGLLIKYNKLERISVPIKDLTEKMINDDQFSRDLNLSNEMASWERLNQVCGLISSKITNAELRIVLKTNCALRAKPSSQSLQVLSASDLPAKNQLIIGLKALAQVKNGDLVQASRELGSINAPFFELIRAKICLEKKELECAVDKSKQIIAEDRLNLEAYLILAKALKLQMKRPLAMDTVRQGLKLSKLYLPLVELAEELGVQ